LDFATVHQPSQRCALAPLGRPISALLFVGAVLAVLSTTRGAQADVSSWAFAGGGVSYLQQRGIKTGYNPSLLLEIGLGTPPTNALVFGGVLALQPQFGHGSDLALLFRSATRGYATGDFGLALDLGPYERLWGEKSVGGEGMLWLGAPWGISLGAGGNVGDHEARGFSAILGFDFARLTVYRSTGTNWFPNPFPSPPARD